MILLIATDHLIFAILTALYCLTDGGGEERKSPFLILEHCAAPWRIVMHHLAPTDEKFTVLIFVVR